MDNVFYVDYHSFQKVNFKTLDTTTLWFYSEDSFRKRRKTNANSYWILSQATSTITATLTVSSGLVCDKFPCSAWTNFHPNKQTGTVKAACQRVPPNTRVFVGPVTMAPINVDPWRLRWGAARTPTLNNIVLWPSTPSLDSYVNVIYDDAFSHMSSS